MRNMRIVWITAVLAVLLAAGAGVWTGAVYHARIAEAVGGRVNGDLKSEPLRSDMAATGPKKQRKVLYWTDTMYNPPYISDKPGKSPMGMDLTPVYEEEVAAGPAISIDPVVIQNMGIRVTPVIQGVLNQTLRAVGTLAEPEQNHTEVNLRVSGWIQKLYANTDGMPVAAGDKLFDLYSPELTVAADELISARKAVAGLNSDADAVLKSPSNAMLDAAKRKLSLLGLSEKEIEAIAALDKAPATISILSPMTGHVTEKAVVEGSAVKAGDRVMRIADRSTMWLQVQVYQHDLPAVAVGMAVVAEFKGLPGKTFEGRVEFIYPHLDMMTRTATVRVVLPNEGHQLHEGMYATVRIEAPAAASAMLLPREAVIDSGTRQIVFIALQGGHFEPRQVTVGRTGHLASSGSSADNTPAGDDLVQILTGLRGDETVVTSGQFLLDSESRIKEATQKYLRDRLAATGGGVATLPAGVAVPQSPATRPAAAPVNARLDALYTAYLDFSTMLATKDERVSPAALEAAAGAVTGQSGDARLTALVGAVHAAADDLADMPVDKQREAFKRVSAAMAKLAETHPPSHAVGAALFQFHCPMADADWLQRTPEIANPYLASMRTCGTATRKITQDGVEIPAPPAPGGGAP